MGEGDYFRVVMADPQRGASFVGVEGSNHRVVLHKGFNGDRFGNV